MGYLRKFSQCVDLDQQKKKTMTRSSVTLANKKTEVRISTIMALPAILRRLGTNPTEVFSAAGVDLKLFDDPDNRLSYATRNHLIAHCVAKTGCQHLGLLIGQQIGLESLGMMGLLVRYSPNVGVALTNLVNSMHLHVRGAMVNLEKVGNTAILSYEVYQPGVEATDQVGDGAVAGFFNIMQSLCGPDWKPITVQFAHGTPLNTRPYHEFFHAPLHFDSELNAMVFAADWLNHDLSENNPESCRALKSQINALEIKYGDDWPGQVRSVLRMALVTGQYKSEQVAAIFSIHSRTLSRRLMDFGTSFQELLDEGRFEISRQLLEDTRLSVLQIAMTLDYDDASSFIRAFKRWSGTTPMQWRKNRKAGSTGKATG